MLNVLTAESDHKDFEKTLTKRYSKTNMRKKYLTGAVLLAVALVIVLAYTYFRKHTVAVLSPSGTIAAQERHLIFIALALCAVVVVPVFFMAFWFAWKYRIGNTKTKRDYRPDWGNSRWVETVWWGVPALLILILSFVTWQASHNLDPYKPLASSQKPITVQVVALNWKWLFIYPDQKVASVNFAQIPVNTPVNFEITSDAPMNSFWVPQLAGQIYAMTGMTTQLHLSASKAGSYRGSSANISGQGFAGMNFTVRAGSVQDFSNWVAQARQSRSQLTNTTYAQLAKDSKNNPVTLYASVTGGLYDSIVMKYMEPTQRSQPSSGIANSSGGMDKNMNMNGTDMSNMSGMGM